MLLELGLAAAACFGAASRDPEVPCTNPALERTVTPSLAAARTLPNSPCRSIAAGSPSVCRFGDPGGATTVALVGDSHAGHWRAAFEHVAKAKGWRGRVDHPLELPAAEGAARPARAAADAVPALEARRVRVVRAPSRGDDGVRGRAVQRVGRRAERRAQPVRDLRARLRRRVGGARRAARRRRCATRRASAATPTAASPARCAASARRGPPARSRARSRSRATPRSSPRRGRGARCST